MVGVSCPNSKVESRNLAIGAPLRVISIKLLCKRIFQESLPCLDGGTDPAEACGLTWQGEFYLFGGKSEQISKLVDFKFEGWVYHSIF